MAEVTTADRDVADGLRGGAAETGDEDRAEHRVAAGAEEQVHPWARHALDQVGRRRNGVECIQRGVEVVRGADAEVDPADLGLVNHGGVENLDRHGQR